MTAKQTADEDAPANSFHRVLEAEKVFNTQRIILDLIFISRILEQIFV